LKILFLTYISRSGSTLLSNLLNQYDPILSCPEADILVKKLLYNPHDQIFNDKLFSNVINDQKFSCWNLTLNELEYLTNYYTHIELFLKILELYKNKTKPDAKIILFKSVELIDLVEVITNAIPALATFWFLSLIRDCRGIFLSQKSTLINNRPMNDNPLITAYQWDSFVKKSIALEEENLIKILKYEELVRHPNEKIDGLLKDVQLNEKLIKNNDNKEYFDRLSQEQKHIHPLIITPPDPSRIDRWKFELNQTSTYLIESITDKSLKRMGYVVYVRSGKIWYYLSKLYYKLLILLKISRYG